jgi:predicted HicB family RNase H-like nuclease
MIDASKYTITIRKGDFDGEECFEARIAELPDVAEYADSYEEAYALAIDTIETTAEIFAEKGKVMPSPIIPLDDYSGRVTLRLPKSLHRTLSQAAEKDGISLNQHLVNMLSYCTGYTHGTEIHNSLLVWQYSVPEKTQNKPTHLMVVKSSSNAHPLKQYA